MKLLPNKNEVVRRSRQSGFTLIELLVVIGILAVLLAIVLIAINPARQFAQANNTQRRSDVNSILNAIHQYSADNRGNLPSNIPAGGTVIINSAGTGSEFCEDIVPTYIAELPRDPSTGTYLDCNSYDTNYEILVATPGAFGPNTPRLTILAPDAELDISISVTR